MTSRSEKCAPTYTDYKNRAAWLADRWRSIGASEIAVICGASNMSTPQELWAQKTKKWRGKDISAKPEVAYGTEAEQYLRRLFELKFKDSYAMTYHSYRVYHSATHPYLSCTLDGELYDIETHEQGVWECKTALINSKAAIDEWRSGIPQKYYCQVLQQLYVMNYSFAVLTAELRFPDGNSETRNYNISAAGAEADTEYIIGEAEKFWRYVKEKRKPPIKLTL